ncbi:MAG TPA: DUF1801 domain-containing protein [Labilithrix sp.]|nr:DUF1801 domain-containing protein [Labilithrix sp.]
MMTPSAYIAAVDPEKQPSLKKLHQLIRKTLPELDPCMVHGMIGYGPYHYRYKSGREGDSARVALAANRTGYSVYIMAVDANGRYLAENAKATLGKAVVGKSCIRFKRIEDVSLDALTDVLRQVRESIALGERRDTSKAADKKGNNDIKTKRVKVTKAKKTKQAKAGKVDRTKAKRTK